MKPKVLIVEDEERWQHPFEALLVDKVEVIIAPTIQAAEKLFQENPDLSAILMDAQVMASFPNTMELVRKFRMSFTGPMIAMSSAPSNIKLLMEAGCNYGTEKDKAVDKVLEVLGYV
jgi:DNA-binding response OmpR family regulator